MRVIRNIINRWSSVISNAFGCSKKVIASSSIGSINGCTTILPPHNISPPKQNCVILVPCNGGIEHKTDETLRILESKGYEVWRNPSFSAIDQGRNRMIYDAVYLRGFEEVLWIDSDINFKAEDVERIRRWDRDIVAAAYPMKGWPIMTVQPLPDKPIEFHSNGKLEEVMCAATGFLYIKSSVLRKLELTLNLPTCNTSFTAPQIPFFKPDVWNVDGENYYLGEDFSFCMRARECGYNIWLDTGIKLGHIGKYTYEWEDVINKTGLEPKLCGKSNFVYTPFTSDKKSTINIVG